MGLPFHPDIPVLGSYLKNPPPCAMLLVNTRSEEEQLSNRSQQARGSEIKMQEWLNAETIWAGSLLLHVKHEIGLRER